MAVPRNYGQNVSMPACLSFGGVSAPKTIAGSVDGNVFRAYIEQVRCRTLSAGDVAVMDKLSVHKVAGVRELIAQGGATLMYSPPRSPDFNPIEKCRSKLKTALRAVKGGAGEALEAGLERHWKR